MDIILKPSKKEIIENVLVSIFVEQMLKALILNKYQLSIVMKLWKNLFMNMKLFRQFNFIIKILYLIMLIIKNLC